MIVNNDRLEELQSKELLNIDEAKELGYMLLHQLIRPAVAC